PDLVAAGHDQVITASRLDQFLSFAQRATGDPELFLPEACEPPGLVLVSAALVQECGGLEVEGLGIGLERGGRKRKPQRSAPRHVRRVRGGELSVMPAVGEPAAQRIRLQQRAEVVAELEGESSYPHGVATPSSSRASWMT